MVAGTTRQDRTQQLVDAFYAGHGPCCAGCDHWRWFNSVAGECHLAPPVAGADRVAMLGITGASMQIGAGHIMTRRDHLCGQFRDEGRADQARHAARSGQVPGDAGGLAAHIAQEANSARVAADRVAAQSPVVAGAGFEPATSGL